MQLIGDERNDRHHAGRLKNKTLEEDSEGGSAEGRCEQTPTFA